MHTKGALSSGGDTCKATPSSPDQAQLRSQGTRPNVNCEPQEIGLDEWCITPGPEALRISKHHHKSCSLPFYSLKAFPFWERVSTPGS